MKSRFALATMLLLILTTGPLARAGKYNPDRNIGDHFKGFTDLAATDGKKYSLGDFAEADVLVIAFTCNSCPYATDYEDRFQAFHQKHAQNEDVAFIAINCNLVPADSLEKMKAKAKEEGFTFPYLFDESQQTGKALGALRTPECFVLNKDRDIVYMGAFDDSTNAAQVEKEYVANAVDATLRGEAPAIAETPPVGCLIRYKRKQ